MRYGPCGGGCTVGCRRLCAPSRAGPPVASRSSLQICQSAFASIPDRLLLPTRRLALFHRLFGQFPSRRSSQSSRDKQLIVANRTYLISSRLQVLTALEASALKKSPRALLSTYLSRGYTAHYRQDGQVRLPLIRQLVLRAEGIYFEASGCDRYTRCTSQRCNND